MYRYWKRRLAEHLKSCGYKVVEEFPIGGGKTIDLLATRDGKRIALEIETGKANIVANVQKCIEAGIGEVFVVATSANLRDSLARKLESCPNTTIVSRSSWPGNSGILWNGVGERCRRLAGRWSVRTRTAQDLLAPQPASLSVALKVLLLWKTCNKSKPCKNATRPEPC